MLPRTRSEWRECIEHKCGIVLTAEFAEQRLSVYRDQQHAETKQFIALYGEQHYRNIVSWFHSVAYGNDK